MFYFFFFKQKTAYEMRISDWSSDVCSSDLAGGQKGAGDDAEVHGRGDVGEDRAGQRAAGKRPGPEGVGAEVDAGGGGQLAAPEGVAEADVPGDRKSTRLNSSH